MILPLFQLQASSDTEMDPDLEAVANQVIDFMLENFAHLDLDRYSIYIMRVSCWLFFSRRTYVSLLVGLGQKSSVLCMLLCPNGQKTSSAKQRTGAKSLLS